MRNFSNLQSVNVCIFNSSFVSDIGKYPIYSAASWLDSSFFFQCSWYEMFDFILCDVPNLIECNDAMNLLFCN